MNGLWKAGRGTSSAPAQIGATPLPITADAKGEGRYESKPCEGAGLPAHNRGHLFGSCPVCLRVLVVIEHTGRLWAHDRPLFPRQPSDLNPFPVMSLFRRAKR